MGPFTNPFCFLYAGFTFMINGSGCCFLRPFWALPSPQVPCDFDMI